MKRPDRSSRSGFLGSLRRAEEAATLAFTAVALGVLLGSAALAVDLGMLIAARVQSQRAADSGALAGAAKLASPGGTEALARLEAKAFADKHNVLTNDVDVNLITDIDVVDDTVRVRVRHTLPTLFARVMGIDEMDVSTVAAAEAVPAGAVDCPIPIMAVDGWDDEPPAGDGDGLYDASENYVSCESGEPCTGYSEDDVGMVMEIKAQNTSSGTGDVQTCGAENPEWYCWVDNVVGTGSVGASELVDIFLNRCQNTDFQVSAGGDLESSPGNKMSVVQAVKNMIDDNGGANLSWKGECVWDATTAACAPSSHPLIRSMPVIDPMTISGSGERARATVNNFAPVWIEKVGETYLPSAVNGNGPPGKWNIYVRLIDGPVDAIGRGGQPDALLKYIVLVE